MLCLKYLVKNFRLIYLFSLVSIFHLEQHPPISPDETIDWESFI